MNSLLTMTRCLSILAMVLSLGGVVGTTGGG